MVKKTYLLALCCMLTGALLGCGEKAPKVDGTYVSINGLSSPAEALRDDVDGGIDDILDEAEDAEDAATFISFDDGEFEMQYNTGQSTYYGKYRNEESALLFDYTEYAALSLADNSRKYYHIDDDPDGNPAAEAIIERMEDFNDSGTYPMQCVPQIYVIDKNQDYGMYPTFMMKGSLMGRLTEGDAVFLKPMGKFLCVDTYGFKLDGKYKAGKDFEIVYNVYDTVYDDEYSLYSVLRTDNDIVERKLDYYYELGFEQDDWDEDSDTTIEFSDGEWKWYNEEGHLINDGEYQESKDYPGLIMMTITEDSDRVDTDSGPWKTYSNCAPLLFYIHDGQIYYPAFVKAE